MTDVRAVLTELLWIPRSAVDVTRLFAQLRITNRSVEQKLRFKNPLSPGETLLVDLWEDGGEWIGVPRGYSPPLRPGVSLTIDDQRIPVPDAPHYKFHRTLRENQKAPAAALLSTLHDKMLCLGCGKGKTNLALWYANETRKKTLVIVDREFLADQWTEEITKCFWTPSSMVGRIQGDEFSIGENFTVVLVHTLAQRDFGEDFYNQFGLVIADECHTLAAPTFRAVVPRFSCERLGLTATPHRKDGLDPIFRLHMGGYEPIYTDISRDRSSSWYLKRLPRLISDEEEARCFRNVTVRVRRGTKTVKERMRVLMRPRYETYACSNEDWFEILCNDVSKAVLKGRNVIVLGGRKDHLESLADTLDAHGISAGLVTSDVKGKDRKLVFKNKQVIAATWQLASRALDVPRLDTLFLLFPTKDDGFIRQAVGRIDRELEGKRDPLVVVYCHDILDDSYRAQGKPGKTDEMIELLRDIDPGAIIRIIGDRNG